MLFWNRYHNKNIEMAYSQINGMLAKKVFPGGKNQARNVIESFAIITNYDIRKLEKRMYSTFLVIYIDVISAIISEVSRPDQIVEYILETHRGYFDNYKKAKEAYVFCMVNGIHNEYRIKKQSELKVLYEADLSKLYRDGKPTNTLEEALKNCYEKIRESVLDFDVMYQNVDCEIVAMLFSLGDYLTNEDLRKRQKVYEIIYSWSSSIIDLVDCLDIIDARKDLYIKTVGGHSVRAEWRNFDDTGVQETAIKCIITVFGDIIFNPNCADNYDDAPPILYSMEKQIYFCDFTMREIQRAIYKFSKFLLNSK